MAGVAGRDTVDQADQLDEDAILVDHGEASGSSVHGHTSSSEAFDLRSSFEAVLIYDRASSSLWCEKSLLS